MKGLLLKDWYMAKKYCKMYLIVAVLFIATAAFVKTNLFFIFYPYIICGMLPFTLMSYDEYSRWQTYSETMPYTRAQIVSAKYLIGLFAQIAVLILSSISQAVQMTLGNGFVMNELISLMMLSLTVSLIASSITPPFMFKLGVEKGRMAYYFMIGVAAASIIIFSNLKNKINLPQIRMDILLAIALMIAIGIFAFSWYLSITFYKKREF